MKIEIHESHYITVHESYEIHCALQIHKFQRELLLMSSIVIVYRLLMSWNFVISHEAAAHL